MNYTEFIRRIFDGRGKVPTGYINVAGETVKAPFIGSVYYGESFEAKDGIYFLIGSGIGVTVCEDGKIIPFQELLWD